jgi:metal-sulfur cluster biosynthetic enzyme
MPRQENPGPSPSPDQIRDILRLVLDPEIGVNIVDLGLIYDIEASPELIHIALTMTSPACPLSEVVISDIEKALAAALPAAPPVQVDLVLEPPWDPAMMSDLARETLGW